METRLTLESPLDHAPVSGSKSQTPQVSLENLQNRSERLHICEVNLPLFANFKTHKSSQVCEDENHHGPWILQDKDTYFVINVVGFCGLFLAPDPIPDTRLTAIILAIPTNSEESKSHLLQIQLWHIPLVLVAVQPRNPQQCTQKKDTERKELF